MLILTSDLNSKYSRSTIRCTIADCRVLNITIKVHMMCDADVEYYNVVTTVNMLYKNLFPSLIKYLSM